MEHPLFTIIMATYNRQDLLPRAIQSILNQTFQDFELLVIDNGSIDDTRCVVMQMEDSRIKYILNPKPTSSCDAPRNLGIKMARGSLISFLDDDDIWYPEKLAKVKKAFDENPEVSAICHNENRNVNGRPDKLLRHGCPADSNLYEVLLYRKNCLSPCAITIKTDLLRKLKGFNLKKEFDAAADYDLWLRMADMGCKFHFIEEALGEFYISGLNWSLKNAAFESRVAFLVKEHILNYEKRPLFAISKKGMWRLFQLYSIAARNFIKAAHYKEAIPYFLLVFLFALRRPTLLLNLYTQIRSKYK